MSPSRLSQEKYVWMVAKFKFKQLWKNLKIILKCDIIALNLFPETYFKLLKL